MGQKGFSSIFLILGGLVIIGLLVGIYYLGNQKNNLTTQNQSTASQTNQLQVQSSLAPSPLAKTDLRQYSNTQYGFSLSYPEVWESQVPEVSSNNFRLDFIKFDQDYNDFERPNIILIINNDDKRSISSKFQKEYSSKGDLESIGNLTGDFYQGGGESKTFAGNTFQEFKADYLVNKENTNYWFRLSTKPELQTKDLEDFRKIITSFKFN